MEKDIPLKIEVLSKEQGDKLRITSPDEIKFVMHFVAEKGNRVALYCSNETDFILTTLLSIDENALWLEQSPNDSDNKRIAKSDQLTFVSSHLQVKVQFVSKSASIQSYQGKSAFYLPLPRSLYRLQRREYFRLTTPILNPLRCVIAQGTPHNKQPREFIIMDVSCGGVGLICMETDTDLEIGRIYSDCRIELPNIGMIKGIVEVRNVLSLPTKNGVTQKRAGCEFKNLDKSSLIMLQRYITNMQRTQVKV